ncbi:hypothetical protein PC110_g5918 [Phytophthora cactorum]|uniref:Uncharacterized protein n=1 Tax=Phytophthora cactorum TaxID=29920 RepID=A0A329SMD7_9STRA|nr:hypothetical protein PC110_g5918 [Phytophthora cactorum]
MLLLKTFCLRSKASRSTGDLKLSTYWKRASGDGDLGVVSETPAIEAPKPATVDTSTRRRASSRKRRRRSTGASRNGQTGEDDEQAVAIRVLPENAPTGIRVAGENAQASEGMASQPSFTRSERRIGRIRRRHMA